MPKQSHTVAELEALLAAARERTNDERAELASPFVESILPHVTFGPSKNDKPWYGATFNATVTTEDGRNVRVSVTLTDVDESALLKKAASTKSA